MLLSTEQMRLATQGIDNRISWEVLERPVGPQPLPAWVKGAHIDWVEGYTNSPRIALKTTCDAREWEGKRFTKEGHFYRARHEDGRMEQYAHNGPLSVVEVSRFKRADGTLANHRRSGIEWPNPNDASRMWYNGAWRQWGFEPGEWVKVPRLATTTQEGFGGAHVDLVMEDGTDLVLRGPWHTSAPHGYAEVSYHDSPKSTGWNWKAPWWQRTGRGGLYITEDLLTRILARFQAHLPIARVTYGGCTGIEPLKPEWDAPKRVIYDREFEARRAAHKGAA